jgi:hypothetical protein
MTATASHGKAVDLVGYDEDGKFMINEAAAEQICKIRENIAVLAITGAYRSGKSFLVNHLMEQQCFAVGHTVKACTKGIWFFDEPVQATFDDGSHGVVLVMDTEGLGATNSTTDCDNQLFTLATLLASRLIYNSSSAISEKSIQKLTFVGNLAKLLKENMSQDNPDGLRVNASDIAPSFVWVLRDFMLKLEDSQKKAISPDEYMENALKRKNGFDAATSARNRTCGALKQFFQERSCRTLPLPARDEATLHAMDSMSPDELAAALRPEFLDRVRALKADLFRRMSPKRVAGGPVSGAGLVALLRAYVAAINGGGVPRLSDAWQSAMHAQAEGAGSAAQDFFEARCLALEARLPLEAGELAEGTDAARAAALERFASAAPTGPASAPRRRALLAALAERTARLRAVNERRSEEQCRALFDQLWAERVSALRDSPRAAEDPTAALADVWAAVEAMRRAYLGGARNGDAADGSVVPSPRASHIAASHIASPPAASEPGQPAVEASAARGPFRLPVLEARTRSALRPVVEQLFAFQEQRLDAMRDAAQRQALAEEEISATLAQTRRQLARAQAQIVRITSELEESKQNLVGAQTRAEASRSEALASSLRADGHAASLAELEKRHAEQASMLAASQRLAAEWETRHGEAAAEAQRSLDASLAAQRTRQGTLAKLRSVRGAAAKLRTSLVELRSKCEDDRRRQGEAAAAAGAELLALAREQRAGLVRLRERGGETEAALRRRLRSAEAEGAGADSALLESKAASARLETMLEQARSDGEAARERLFAEMARRESTEAVLRKACRRLQATLERSGATDEAVAAQLDGLEPAAAGEGDAGAVADRAAQRARIKELEERLEEASRARTDGAAAGSLRGASPPARPAPSAPSDAARRGPVKGASQGAASRSDPSLKASRKKVRDLMCELSVRACVEGAQKGMVVTKYHSKKGQDPRWIIYDASSRQLGWCKANKRRPTTVVRLDDVVTVVYGKKSPTLLDRAAGHHPWCCFYVRTRQRTYSFVTRTADDAIMWCVALQALVEQATGRSPAGGCQSRGALLWKQLGWRLDQVAGRQRKSRTELIASVMSSQSLSRGASLPEV